MKTIRHTKDSVHVAEFAARWPDGWHSYSKDKRTERAVERARQLGKVETNEFRQFRWPQVDGAVIAELPASAPDSTRETRAGLITSYHGPKEENMKHSISSPAVEVVTPSKASPTPGPWTIHNNIGRKGELGVLADGAPCIIAIIGNAKEWPTEAQANARLISAAPDLLAALEDELAALRVWQSSNLPADVVEGIAISIDKVERAIAKATGGTP